MCKGFLVLLVLLFLSIVVSLFSLTLLFYIPCTGHMNSLANDDEYQYCVFLSLSLLQLLCFPSFLC